jgi:hypothetical protein
MAHRVLVLSSGQRSSGVFPDGTLSIMCNLASAWLLPDGPDQIWQGGVEPRGLPDRIGELGQDLAGEQFPPGGQRLRHHVEHENPPMVSTRPKRRIC